MDCSIKRRISGFNSGKHSYSSFFDMYMIQYVKMNKEADNDWFSVESNNTGTRYSFLILHVCFTCIVGLASVGHTTMDYDTSLTSNLIFQSRIQSRILNYAYHN